LIRVPGTIGACLSDLRARFPIGGLRVLLAGRASSEQPERISGIDVAATNEQQGAEQYA
jgi:hypothetical protein